MVVICDFIINEEDEAHHLGILKSVFPSTMPRTNERASRGRSAFFVLNAVGARFGHPETIQDTMLTHSPIRIGTLVVGSCNA